MPDHLGRYRIVRELGKGAMGVVYEGLDPNIGRRVAIKTARRDVLESSAHADEMMERFLREARAAGALNHPNIITIYDAAEESGIAYIAMEFLEGGDLRNVIDERRHMAPEAAAEMGAAICEALASAHDRGVIHRDIKPANIMTPPDGPIKVADFGIAHMSDSTLTQEGALIGTPFYMSPEQFMGQKVDGRSDLFSVAVVLYELITREKPFTGEALSTVMHHVIKTDPVPPHELNFNVPEALSRVLLKSLSKRPADRYQDGRAMAAALRESVKPQPNPAILALEKPGAGAETVITAPTDDATVMMGTARAAAPAAEATVVSASALDVTKPGAPPPDTETGGPPVAAAPPPAVLWTKPPRLYYIVAAATAALLVVALVIALSGGGTQPTPADAGTAPVSTPRDTAVTPENYLTAVRIGVYQTDDDELFGQYIGLGMEDAHRYVGELYSKGLVEEANATVELLDKDRRTVGQGAVRHVGRVECTEPVEEVWIRVTVPIPGDDEPATLDVPWPVKATEPGEIAPLLDVLVSTKK